MSRMSTRIPGVILPAPRDARPRRGRIAPAKPLGDGPGSELMLIFKENGIEPAGNCQCAARAQQMNEWAASGCREHRHEIIGWMIDVTKPAQSTWDTIAADFLGAILDEAICRAEAKEGERAAEKKNRLAKVAVLESIRPEPIEFRRFSPGNVDPKAFFAGVFVISLERTPDRLREFRAAMSDWPFMEPEHYEAFDGSAQTPPDWFQLHNSAARAPAYGCLKSHLGILSLAIANGWDKPVLILEDDCGFVRGAGQALASLLQRVPEDADILYVGCQLFRPSTPIAPGLVRADGGAGRTHAYVVYPRAFRRLFALLEYCPHHIDWELKTLATRGKIVAYAASPVLAIQRANKSTIVRRQEPARSWDSKVAVKSRPKEFSQMIFSHHGDYGDVVYSLMAAKYLCEESGRSCKFYLCPDKSTRALMTEEHAQSILPLLRAQPYIDEACWRPKAVGARLDLALRRFYKHGLNIADQASNWLGLPCSADLSGWLTVEKPNAIARVVFSRSHRYRNAKFPWADAYRRFGAEAVFVGTREEHENFQALIGPVVRADTPTLFDVAQIIAGCELFVGNQSCARAIAEGLKVPVAVEVDPRTANTHFARPDAWYGEIPKVIPANVRREQCPAPSTFAAPFQSPIRQGPVSDPDAAGYSDKLRQAFRS